MSILAERLADLPSIMLGKGTHRNFKEGHCAMEVVAWLAGEGHTDAPECASVSLQVFTVTVNDAWSDTQRQALVPLLPRMVGTAEDGKDQARDILAADWLVRTCAPMLLDVAMFKDEASSLRDLERIVDTNSKKSEDVLLKVRSKLSELEPTIGYSAQMSATSAIRSTGASAATQIQLIDSEKGSLMNLSDLAFEISFKATCIAIQAQFDAGVINHFVSTPIMDTIVAIEKSLLELLETMIDPV